MQKELTRTSDSENTSKTETSPPTHGQKKNKKIEIAGGTNRGEKQEARLSWTYLELVQVAPETARAPKEPRHGHRARAAAAASAGMIRAAKAGSRRRGGGTSGRRAGV